MASEQNNNHINEIENELDDFFWSVTYRYPEEEKVLFSNSVSTITGYTPAELLELPGNFISIIVEEDVDDVKKVLSDLESNISKNRANLTYRIEHKSKKNIWLKEKIKVSRDGNGKIVKINKMAVDITEYKIIETKLKKKTAKLEELNKAKDKFISIVSHDLRSPFTTLLGFSEILINEDEIDKNEQTEYLNYIHDASKTQLHMINNLLDWSRLQTGRVKVEPVRLNLSNLISNCVSSFTGDTVRKDIEVKVDIDRALYIEADERFIDIAFSNIISNAIKFSESGTSIKISAHKFSDDTIEITIIDKGIGIPEVEHQKLFKIDEKFVREGTNKEKGTGLGLTLVHEIIEKHNGKIWFYSKEHEGTEFHIVLNEAKNILLLIEDDENTRKLYCKKLSEELPNFSIVESENGYKAIKLLNEIVPSIILTDHDMPLMNGIQFIEAIRERESYIPVIVISALLTDELKRKYQKLGIHDLVLKPINFSQLVQRISNTL